MFKKIILRIVYRNNKIKYYKQQGVQFGKNCRLVGKVNFGTEPYLIKLGNHVSITSSTFITHDGGVWIFRDKEPDIDVVRPIKVGNNVFIGADCIIMPGVNIGDNVVVGAKSIVTKDLSSNSVYAGVPAKYIKSIDEYREGINPYITRTKKMNKIEKRKFLVGLFNGKL